MVTVVRVRSADASPIIGDVEDLFEAGRYLYMRDLQCISSCVPLGLPQVPQLLNEVRTTLVLACWQSQLSSHPDLDFVSYLLSGIANGFRIGFNYNKYQHRSAKRNMLSATQNPEVVREYLAKECASGRVVGPLERGSLPLQINRFGVIPKPHQPGKWRLIVDLSYPEGESVNDGIASELCSLSYASIDNAAQRIVKRGRGTLLAKVDLESAYRMVPVHPDDRHLLGMEWDKRLYVDTALPFGLRSAPKIFTALADGLLWIMASQGIREAIHYLDDYLLFGDPDTQECAEALRVMLSLCQQLGVPVSMPKIEGPANVLTFLGIELDTVRCELRLPSEKLIRLKSTLGGWSTKISCTKRELLSLIGQLQHACKVVRPGRTFLRRMIDLSTVAKQLHHHIRLTAAFRSDLQWWLTFLIKWNGVSMMQAIVQKRPEAVITSDASGNWGCGAFSSQGCWFQLQWPQQWANVHITIKELLPIVVACAVWGSNWRGQTIQCICDNAAVVAIINSGRSKDKLAMHILRCLFFFTAHFNVSLFAQHLPGRENVAADALSRDNLPLFLQQVPRAKRDPTLLPQELVQALILHQPDWTSVSWRNLFNSILLKV